MESREGHAAPLVLIVDDYQVIDDTAIHQSLTFFLEHLPAHLHLVLASRLDPDLPLARLRARGQLVEIRADGLRFQKGEASQYLGQVLSPPLSEDEVSRLVKRTEGWIAGLHLAALSLEKREDRAAFLQAFTGSQRYLLDYVQEDILARLPERVHDFLLHCAVLSHLSASVCQAVTAAPSQASCQQMLLLLERANLFVVPLDEERRSYRLHELFREALLSMLHGAHPEMVPRLHRRAADFYAAQEEWAEAITHALEASDFSTAAQLMEQTVEQFWLRGEVATMAGFVLALPENLLRRRAQLVLTTALYLLATGMHTAEAQRTRVFQGVRQLMARVESALLPQTDETSQQALSTHADADPTSSHEDQKIRAAQDARFSRRLRLLHIFLVLSEVEANGELERLRGMRAEIEEELDQDEEILWQIIPLSYTFILHYMLQWEGAALVPQLLSAKERANRSASRYATYKVRQYLAFAALEEGRLHLASEESQAALSLIEQSEGFALLKGYFEATLARVWYQWNRLEEAAALLHTLIHEASAWQQLDLLGAGYVDLLRVALATGDGSLAERSLQELEHLVQRDPFSFYPEALSTIRAQWWLTRGLFKEASNWASGVVFAEGPWKIGSYDAFPVVVRVYFAERRFREAGELLERWKEHLDQAVNIRITITYLAQVLVALHQAGKREQAREIATRLFALTEPEGYLRVYLDEGEPMRETLLAVLAPHSEPHEWAAPIRSYIAKLLAAFDEVQQGVSTVPGTVPIHAPLRSIATPFSPISSVLDASLTRREQEVLRLLARGASNQNIAQTLVISLPTVKKHVSNLLGKLGVTNRTQAVAQARARSLL